eukprot:1161361-Pelagomonas_calceolata.AAC.11
MAVEHRVHGLGAPRVHALADGVVRALGLHQAWHTPDIADVVHGEHTVRLNLREQGLHVCMK